MATVIETLVSRLGFSYDPKGIKQHDADVKRSTATLATSERQGKSWGSSLASAGKAAAAGLAVFAGAAVAAGGVAARWAAGAVQDFAKVGDEIAKTSSKLGVTTDELQRMRFAAGRSGASSESLAVAIKTLNRQMLDASKTGKGPLVDALSDLGLELGDLEGMTTEQRFGLLADRLGRIADPARKSALAMKVFGEQGTALVPMLNEGSAGLQRLYATAEQQPDFLDRKQLTDAEKLNDALSDLRASIKGAGNQIASSLAPVVGEMAMGFADWIRQNDKLIKQDLPAMFEGMAGMLSTVGAGVGEAIAEFQQLRREAELWDEWTRKTQEGKIAKSAGSLWWKYQTGSLWGEAFDKASKAFGGGTTNVRGVGFANESDEARASRLSRMAPAELATLLIDPRTSEEDRRAAASAMSGSADRTRRSKQQVDAFASAARGLSSRATDLLGAAGASFAPAAEQASERRRRGGGGRGASKKAESTGETGPSIDELIGRLGEDGASMRDVLDAARTGMPTGRQTPLQGAQIVRIDASYNATTSVTVELPMAAVQEGAERATEKAADMIKIVLDERDRRAFSHYESAVRI